MIEDGKDKIKIKRQWLFLLTFFALTAGCIVFTVLCLANSHIPFVQKYHTWLLVTSIVLLTLCCGFCIWLVLRNKETWIKAFLSVYIFLLFCLVLIYILQKTGFFKLVNSSEGLQSYLEKAGAWMPILYIVLQYLQVIVLPIPSVVSTVAGIALFGPFKTFLFSLMGILLGSVTAFFIGRKLGYKAVAWIVGKETLDKWQKKLKGKDNLILTMMFLLPLFPDDVLCFIAGLSSMSNRYFLLMVFITRIIGIAGTCYSFNFIPFDTWWGLLIWGVFFAAIITAFLLIYKYMDKIQRFLKRFHHRKDGNKTQEK